MTAYEKYLESPKWEDLNCAARARANNQCEFCGDLGHAVHHIKYPKVFSHDCLDNLVLVCRRCHDLLHGIRRSERGLPLKAIMGQMFQELRQAEL